MTDSPLLAAAIAYANRGYSVIPLRPGEKKPILVSWKDYQTKHLGEADLRGFWHDTPNANVAIITGRISGLSVVDLDGSRAVDALKENGISLPPTRVHRTPHHGWHYLYRYTDQLKQGAGFADGVDVRNNGGYIVAPPSVLDVNCGKHDCPIPPDQHLYRILKDVEPVAFADVPDIFRRIRANANGQHPDLGDQPAWVARALLEGAPDHQRNDTATRLAGYFRSINMPQDIALAALNQFATACNPPFDFAELTSVVKSVWRYAPTRISHDPTLPAPIVEASIPNRRIFSWPDREMKITVDRLRENPRGISGWLRISRGGTDIYGPSIVNLLKDADLSAARTALKEIDDGIPWVTVLAHVRRHTIDSMTQQINVVDGALFTPSHTNWLAEPFVKERQPSVMFGDGEAGKSTFATAIALSVATGYSFIPGMKVHKSGPVLYVDAEASEDDVIGNMQQIMTGAPDVKLDPDRFIYLRMTGAIADRVEELMAIVASKGVVLVICDSLIALAGDDVNQADQPRLYYGVVRNLGCASLGITHRPTETAKMYGSVFYRNLARVAWFVESDDSQGNPVMLLKRNKLNRGTSVRSMAFEVMITDESIRYINADATVSDKLEKGMSVSERIMSHIDENKMNALTLDELVIAIPDIPRDTINRTLNRLKKRRLLVQLLPSMKWGKLKAADSPDSVRGQSGPDTRTDDPPLRRGGGSVSADVSARKEADVADAKNLEPW